MASIQQGAQQRCMHHNLQPLTSTEHSAHSINMGSGRHQLAHYPVEHLTSLSSEMTAAPSPYSEVLAMRTASSSLEKLATASTGPNTCHMQT